MTTVDSTADRVLILERLLSMEGPGTGRVFLSKSGVRKVIWLFNHPILRKCHDLSNLFSRWEELYCQRWQAAKSDLVRMRKAHKELQAQVRRTYGAKQNESFQPQRRPASTKPSRKEIENQIGKFLNHHELDELIESLRDRSREIAQALSDVDFSQLVEELALYSTPRLPEARQVFTYYGSTCCVINGQVMFGNTQEVVQDMFSRALEEWGPSAYYFLRELLGYEYDQPMRVRYVLDWFSEHGVYVPSRLPKDLWRLGLLERVEERSQFLGYRFHHGVAEHIREMLDRIEEPPLPIKKDRPIMSMNGTVSTLRHPHSSAVAALEDIGGRLAKRSAAEYSFEDYRFDVVWLNVTDVTHVFEVQHRGGLEHALTNLLVALRNLDCVPVLVVSAEKDATRARRLVHRQGAPFSDLGDDLVVLSTSDILLISQWLRARDEQVSDLIARLRVQEDEGPQL